MRQPWAGRRRAAAYDDEVLPAYTHHPASICSPDPNTHYPAPHLPQAGGPPKMDAVSSARVKIKDYGYMHMDAWDFLWTITAKAMLAAEILRPGGECVGEGTGWTHTQGECSCPPPSDAQARWSSLSPASSASRCSCAAACRMPPPPSFTGQMVSIVPGFLSITRKTSLVRSLRSVYGDDGAFAIVPRTFKLPDEMDEWAGGCATEVCELGFWS